MEKFSLKQTKKQTILGLSFLIMFFSSQIIFGGTTGKLHGRITDSQTKMGLPGVNIVIDELKVGAVTDNDGYYFIMNIPSGTYSVRAYMISYQEIKQENVKIGADMSVKINFTMNIKSIEMDSVYVIAKEEVSKSITQQERTLSKELLKQDLGTDIIAVIKRQPGVVEDASGKIHIRGGREDEIGYMIDGMSIVEPIFRTQVLSVNKMFADEVKLITGGFNAEYGEAMSGILNILSKEGKDKPYGNILYEGNSFLPEELNNGDNHLMMELGGPILKKYLKYYLSGEIYVTDYFTPKYHSTPTFFYSNDDSGYAFYFNEYEYTAYKDSFGRTFLDSTATLYRWREDSIPYFKYGADTIFLTETNIMGDTTIDTIIKTKPIIDTVLPSYYNQSYMDSMGHIFPHNRHSEYNGQTKLTFTPSTSVKLNANIMYSKFSSEIMNNLLKYNPDRGLNENGHSLHISATGNLLINQANLLTFSINRISNASTLSHGFPEEFYVDNEDGTIDTFRPSDEYYVKWYEIWKDYSTMDEYSFENLPSPDQKYKNNTPWGFNPYSVEYAYPYYLGLYRKFASQTNELKMDWQSVLNKNNEAKFGFDLKTYDIRMLTLRVPWSTFYTRDEFTVSPKSFSFYAQDKLEYEMMVLNFGLRFEYFNPNTPYYTDKTLTYNEPLYLIDTVISGTDTSFVKRPNIDSDSLYAGDYWPVKMAEIKYNLSPRFGISYPMAPNSYLRFNYGHFYQTPQMAHLYTNLVTDASNTENTVIFGNPNLKPEHSISYEMEVESEIRKNLFFTVAAFYKDFYDLVGVRSVSVLADKYFIYTNNDYANSKGLELTIAAYDKFLTYQASYTLMYASGTSSSADEKFNKYSFFYDPETGEELASVTSLKYMDFDQRHTFNITYSFKSDYLNVPVYAKKIDLTFYHAVKSGQPYQSTIGSLVTMFDNSSRMPWGFYSDMKFSKRFRIDRFNGALSLKLNNIFDVKNIIDVYGETGEADNDGKYSNVKMTDFESDYKMGDPYYDCRMDLDNNGTVTILEQYMVYVQTYKDYSYNPHNYASPRTIMVTLEFGF